MTRQAARRDETRGRLASAAQALFSANGYEATTIDAIVGRAGTSRRTFFRYFASKDELVFDGLLRHFDDVVEAVSRRTHGSDRTAVAEAVLLTARLIEEDGEAARAAVDMIRNNRSLRACWLEATLKWQTGMADALAERAGSAPELEHRVLAAVAVAAYEAGLLEWCGMPSGRSLVDVTRSALVAAGLPSGGRRGMTSPAVHATARR